MGTKIRKGHGMDGDLRVVAKGSHMPYTLECDLIHRRASHII